MSEQGVWGRHRKLVPGRESETRTASHLSALRCQEEASGVSCPPMFSVPVFTWTTCSTVNKRSHKRLAEQAKQAEGLLAFSSHPGLCALSTVNLWAVLISSPRCFNPKSSFSLLLPALIPATFFSPMVFLTPVISVSVYVPTQTILLALERGAVLEEE